MPKIRAFNGYRYDPKKVDMASALCPPYDIVTPDQVETYYSRLPFNAIRIEASKLLPGDTKTNNRYTRAKDDFNKWIKDGILVRDGKPCVYYHEQTFKQGEETCTRGGFIASVRIDEGDKRYILPHETTTKGPKLDRLRLMNEIKANSGGVFGVYSDPKRIMETQVKPGLAEPLSEFKSDEITHRLWVIRDKKTIEKLTNMMIDKKILIADGHHRYETAKAYRDRMRVVTGKKSGNEEFDYTMMYLCNMDEGLTILPTHRIVLDSMGIGLVDLEYRIKEIFNMTPFDNKKQFLEALKKGGSGHIGLYVKGIQRYYLLETLGGSDLDKFMPLDVDPLLKKLDVNVLQTCVLEPIMGIEPSMAAKRLMYTSDAVEALGMVESEKADVVFLLNPSSLKEVMRIAEAGLRMPQKSTYFYPKVPAGLVFHPLQ